MSNLVDALIAEMARVRDQVMPSYLAIGAPGVFALAMMRNDLDAAARALAEQDGVSCLRLYESLKGFNT